MTRDWISCHRNKDCQNQRLHIFIKLKFKGTVWNRDCHSFNLLKEGYVYSLFKIGRILFRFKSFLSLYICLWISKFLYFCISILLIMHCIFLPLYLRIYLSIYFRVFESSFICSVSESLYL